MNMTLERKKAWLGTMTFLLSVLFFASVVIFGFNDSSYHSKTLSNYARMAVGLGMAAVAAFAIYTLTGRSVLRDATQSFDKDEEKILDDREVTAFPKNVSTEDQSSALIYQIHLVLALILAFGDWVGFSYAVIQTFGIVYCMLVFFITMNFIPVLFGRKFGG